MKSLDFSDGRITTALDFDALWMDPATLLV